MLFIIELIFSSNGHFYRLKESLEHIDKQVTVIEPNQVKLLQEQNITLAKQLQEIKWILDELKEFKTIEQINSNKINNDNIERIEISLVGFKNMFL